MITRRRHRLAVLLALSLAVGLTACGDDDTSAEPDATGSTATSTTLVVDDLVAALQAQPGVEVSDPVDTTFAGLRATRLDFSVPPGADLTECRLFEAGVDGLQIWYSEPADKYFVLGPDNPASAFILDVDGERQVFLTQQSTATSADDLVEMQTILDSIRIAP